MTLPTDTAARNATDAELIGLLQLRQATLVMNPSHPHRAIFEAARDSAIAELKQRLALVQRMRDLINQEATDMGL